MKLSLHAFSAALVLSFLIPLPEAHGAPSKEPKPAANPKADEVTPSPKKTSAKATPPKKAAVITAKAPSMGKNKGDIEAYLKLRLDKLRAGNKDQIDFNADENHRWQEFWGKVKEERELFEVRLAKQRLNVFESLDSLEHSEHSKTIADFERMQSNVLRSFETAQRSKVVAFFSALTERTKAFAVKQEKDRAAFAEEAEASWRQLKSGFAVAPAAHP